MFIKVTIKRFASEGGSGQNLGRVLVVLVVEWSVLVNGLAPADCLCVPQVQYVQAPSFGYRPVKMTCPHCQSSITTKTEEEASALAWIICGACCLFGFWPCACVPFCVDSLQAVRQQCIVFSLILDTWER